MTDTFTEAQATEVPIGEAEPLPPRWYRRAWKRIAAKLQGGTGVAIFLLLSAAYLWKFYGEIVPLLMPLWATNPTFLLATAIIAVVGGLMILGRITAMLFRAPQMTKVVAV